MSGTSVDAIDAVLLDITENDRPILLSTHSEPFPAQLRETILSLCQPGPNEIDQAGRIHTELGERYAGAALKLIEQCGNPQISVIGCHGQTVRHRPTDVFPFTLQLGNGAVIAQRTGIPTVTDFRSADISLGGQGAPLAPVFHQAVFSDHSKTRAIVNLGGIANITLLPNNPSTAVTGFDTGPANGLMDNWIALHQNQPFDRDGQWGRSGKLNQGLLALMLSDPFFALPPPKSTGREYFNLNWLEQCLSEFGQDIAPMDVQHTLAWLTAQSVANQIGPSVDQIYLCGGGTDNGFLRQILDQICSQDIATTDQLGFPSAWIEASAFAWMAQATINRTPATLASVTGASASSIAGAIYYPSPKPD